MEKHLGKSIRILFITHVPQLGGANRSLLQLIKELRDSYNVEPYVLLPKTHYEGTVLKDKLEEEKVPYFICHIQFFKESNPDWRYALRGHLKYLYKNRNLYKKLQEYHFDIIHTNTSIVDIGGYLSKLLKVKHVWHLREFGDIDYGMFPVGGKLYEKFTYQNADAFIAISKSIKAHFSKKISKSKIHLIYNGIEFSRNYVIADHNNENIQFVIAGVISEGKNQKEIILASYELLRQGILNFHVTIVGKKTHPYIDDIERLIESYALEDFITILPEVDGIQDLLSKMDVGVVPSKAEAFGRTTIEFQLQNLLVIANDSGANPELINDGETGFIYKSGDINELAQKMKIAIKDKGKLCSIAEMGRCNALNHFLSTHNTKAIYELYKTLL